MLKIKSLVMFSHARWRKKRDFFVQLRQTRTFVKKKSYSIVAAVVVMAWSSHICQYRYFHVPLFRSLCLSLTHFLHDVCLLSEVVCDLQIFGEFDKALCVWLWKLNESSKWEREREER